jgi:hypothetical protein
VLIRSLAQVIEDAKADGVVDWFDVLKLGRLKDYASAALRGSQDIPAELLDMDADELRILLEGLIDAVTKLINAVRR